VADGKPRIAVWIGAAVVAAGAVAAVLAISGGGSRTSGTGGSADAERGEGAGAERGVGVGSTSAGSGSPAGSETASETGAGLLATARTEAAAGRYVQALGHYQRAYALDSAPSTLLEVGRMQHLSGRCREARRTTQRVLAASPPADLAGNAQDLLVRIGRCD
jgi:tetratricopeptide (TPR) repeat protein